MVRYESYINHHNRKRILEECERAEDDSMKAYEKALEETSNLPTPIVSILRKHAEIQKLHMIKSVCYGPVLTDIIHFTFISSSQLHN